MDRFSAIKDGARRCSFFISGHPLDKFKFEMQHISTKGGLALLENIDVIVSVFNGGTISNAEHRISQAAALGTVYSEDYDGSYEFRCSVMTI